MLEKHGKAYEDCVNSSREAFLGEKLDKISEDKRNTVYEVRSFTEANFIKIEK